MEWGGYADSISESTLEAHTLPFMQSMPAINQSETEVVEGFNYLSSSRQIGMSAGPIPFSEIAIYAEMTEQPDFWGYVFKVQQLDAEYVRVATEKSK